MIDSDHPSLQEVRERNTKFHEFLAFYTRALCLPPNTFDEFSNQNSELGTLYAPIYEVWQYNIIFKTAEILRLLEKLSIKQEKSIKDELDTLCTGSAANGITEAKSDSERKSLHDKYEKLVTRFVSFEAETVKEIEEGIKILNSYFAMLAKDILGKPDFFAEYELDPKLGKYLFHEYTEDSIKLLFEKGGIIAKDRDTLLRFMQMNSLLDGIFIKLARRIVELNEVIRANSQVQAPLLLSNPLGSNGQINSSQVSGTPSAEVSADLSELPRERPAGNKFS